MLFVAEIIRAECAGGDKSIGASVVEFYEQAGASDAADAAGKSGADAVGKMVRNEAIGGLALGLHGTAFGGGNLCGDFAERCHVHVLRCPVVAELAGADEGTMHGKGGVARGRRRGKGRAGEI